ncbi:hypothetical protein ACFQ3S_01720 [Mucilaginibacter terrae]|uniref:hypothetical protein n=1 Tax=Mucilaginibacter terrae TaxID=1955052 RepID=UPI0036404BFF
MKKILLVIAFCGLSFPSRAQQKFLSYEDIVYIETNNLQKTADFMLTKGYTALKTKKADNLKYKLTNDGNTSEVEIRLDGRRIYVYIATDEIMQVNLITNSIAPFLISKEDISGVINYKVKDLGNIYMMVSDKTPYSPIKKDYDIRIVSEKNITTYN